MLLCSKFLPPILLPECSAEPWGEAHSEELLPCYWLTPGDSLGWELLVWAQAVAAAPVPWFISWSRLRHSNRAYTLGPCLHLEYEAGDKNDCAFDLGWVILWLRGTGIWVWTGIYNLACYHCSLSRMLRDGFGVLFFSRQFLSIYVRDVSVQ